MQKIVLFGCGNLGRRYIQAISKLNIDVNLCIFDISVESIRLTKKFIIENNISIERIEFTTNFEFVINLLSNNTLVILASTAFEREKTLISVIQKEVKAIICEKPVTQGINKFNEVIFQSQKYDVPIYVNYTLRFQQFYRQLKDEIEDKNKIVFISNLPLMGLACVGIHQIDLFFWLFNINNYKIESSFFLGTYEQKRQGFFDIIGSVQISNKSGVMGFFNNSQTVNIRSVQIITPQFVYNIFEDQKLITILNKNINGKIEYRNIEYSFVSQYMTEEIMNIIEGNSKIISPKIEESYLSHKVIFDYLKIYNLEGLNIT